MEYNASRTLFVLRNVDLPPLFRGDKSSHGSVAGDPFFSAYGQQHSILQDVTHLIYSLVQRSIETQVAKTTGALSDLGEGDTILTLHLHVTDPNLCRRKTAANS